MKLFIILFLIFLTYSTVNGDQTSNDTSNQQKHSNTPINATEDFSKPIKSPKKNSKMVPKTVVKSQFAKNNKTTTVTPSKITPVVVNQTDDNQNKKTHEEQASKKFNAINPNMITNTVKPTKKRKPKPRITVGELEADKPIPPSPTNKSSNIEPDKGDYIIPILITFTALPLLGATFYALYKRGRDYWDKRHYRRMDFLINGMYNE